MYRWFANVSDGRRVSAENITALGGSHEDNILNLVSVTFRSQAEEACVGFGAAGLPSRVRNRRKFEQFGETAGR